MAKHPDSFRIVITKAGAAKQVSVKSPFGNAHTAKLLRAAAKLVEALPDA